MKIQILLETADDVLDGDIIETTKDTIINDIRTSALKTWSREEIRLGNLVYNDLTNHIYSRPIHDKVFPEDYDDEMDIEW